MDKKNTILGVLFLAAAFVLIFYGKKNAPPSPPAPELTRMGPVAGANGNNQSPGPATANLPISMPSDATFAPLASTNGSAKVVTLENDFVEVHFVDFGGAIENVGLKKYPARKESPDPFIFNGVHTDPMLAFTAESFPGMDPSKQYQLVSQTANEVVFRAVFENRIEVTRHYVLPPSDVARDKGDPYQIYSEITFRNLTDQTVPLPHFALALGTAAPENPSDVGLSLATGYNDGKDIDFIKRTKLEGGGLFSKLGIGSRDPIPRVETNASLLWASVGDQFFVGILTPEKPAHGLVTRRVQLPPFPGSETPVIGVSGAAGFDVPALAPNGQNTVAMNFYVGPKEYRRLSNPDVFKQDQDKVMQFGMLHIFSQILLTMMTAIHGWVGNWGVAIILTTLSLKTIFLPLTLSASRSAKRMQKLQPQMVALQEKYKDNPQKLNQAKLELFKENKVNPVGGCLPVLITMPFFWGFFRMLGNTAELRFAEFLWAKDLSLPDTVARIAHFPINIMPILLGITMIVQMRLTPQPTADNSQAKMFKFMPYLFTLFCYSFSCALSLYSTVNGIFTIGQQLIINRMKDRPEPIASPAGNALRTIKNVTPGKKKNR